MEVKLPSYLLWPYFLFSFIFWLYLLYAESTTWNLNVFEERLCFILWLHSSTCVFSAVTHGTKHRSLEVLWVAENDNSPLTKHPFYSYTASNLAPAFPLDCVAALHLPAGVQEPSAALGPVLTVQSKGCWLGLTVGCQCLSAKWFRKRRIVAVRGAVELLWPRQIFFFFFFSPCVLEFPLKSNVSKMW